ncbi:MAG: hypothetical protein EA369_07745 [Bradymonadales bacterium]|nr:MAG: hypothetical protein EA369_07745 [Bradymonadales bacterium]
MTRCLVFFVGLCLLSSGFVGAENRVRRVALIDLNSDDLDEGDRFQFLDRLADQLGRGRDFVLVSRQEIQQRLLRPHPRVGERQEFFQEVSKRWSRLEPQILRLSELYLASQFAEVVSSAERIWLELPLVGDQLGAQDLIDFVAVWAASLWFLERETELRQVLEMLWSILDRASLGDRFPPDFIEVVENHRRRFQPKRRTVNIQVNPVSASFRLFGQRLEYQRGALKLPDSEYFSPNTPILVDAPDHIPQWVSIRELSEDLSLESVESQARAVGSLFRVLHAQTAPFALIEIGELVGADVILLMNLSLRGEGFYESEAQWLELSTGRRSLVVDARARTIDALIEIVSSKLKLLIRDNARVLSPSQAIEEVPLFRDREASKTNLLNQWWFWTLVGAGIIGTGAGAYFLLKPDQRTRLNVTWE